MSTEEVKKLVGVYADRIAAFWNYNGMLEHQDREINISQRIKSNQYETAVYMARDDLYRAIEGLEKNGA